MTSLLPVTPPDAPEPDEESNLRQLQRWVVIVLLVLLIIGQGAEFIDKEVFHQGFTLDGSFYVVVGGMVTGLFAGALLENLYRRK